VIHPRVNKLQCHRSDAKYFEINYFLGKAYLYSPTPGAGLFYLNRVDSLLQPDPKILSTLHNDKQFILSAIGNYVDALRGYKMAYKYDLMPEYIFFLPLFISIN